MAKSHIDAATVAGVILIIIATTLAVPLELNDGWHQSRCHAAAQAVFPPHTLIGLASVDYKLDDRSDFFSGPTRCEFTLGYREPGFGACWIWVDRIRAWNHLSGCYTQPPTTDTQREAAQSWAADITHDGELFRITVP